MLPYERMLVDSSCEISRLGVPGFLSGDDGHFSRRINVLVYQARATDCKAHSQ